MLFNSLDFAIFLPIIFTIYWIIRSYSLKIQNGFIVLASYIFYGWWDWRFLSLIIFSTLVDFLVGQQLGKEAQVQQRKLLLWISILVNVGLLAFFKYFNFFIDNFITAFSFFGIQLSIDSLYLILPVGISFYTFQTLSYTIDVYRKKIQPTQDFIAFAAFVSFFPQLVAGPIERASHLLPQFYKPRSFDYQYARDGMRQILWGFFKKIVIADNCAQFVNVYFENPSEYPGSILLLGAVLFAFQIYGDFSGYSDIAIGTAKLFGFDLMQNFAFPYFSRDIAEFWRRWHISLSTWFRDYLYIPLGGSRGKKPVTIRNVFIIFLVSGFWHGANWTFIIWGGLHALYFLPLLLAKQNRRYLSVVAQGRYLPNLWEMIQILVTFLLTCLAWVFFRAKDLSQAILYISGIFSGNFWGIFPIEMRNTIILIAILLLIEWFGRANKHGFDFDQLVLPTFLRWSLYILIALLIIIFGNFGETEFIYFVF